MSIIKVRNVSKWYGTHQVLTKCSLTVNKGDVVVVCGPSGSGKSTFIKTVNGLEAVQAGSIEFDGQRIDGLETKQLDLHLVRARFGMVFQNFELFPHLTVEDNLCLGQVKVLGRSKKVALEKGRRC